MTFVDLLAKDIGLLVLHPGTQFFKRQPGRVLSNLLMREWESHFAQEYGWPVYTEYRHALLPHTGNLDNGDRIRAAMAFTRPLFAVVSAPHGGSLQPAGCFIETKPHSVQLSAFRKRIGPGYELRVVETEGREAEASIGLELPVQGGVETDLLGRKIADVARDKSGLTFRIQPWKIRTFQIT